MSETTSEKMGFEILGQFYDWVALSAWKSRDFRLARELTGYDEQDLFGGKASLRVFLEAHAAVAMAHARPELSREQLVVLLEDLGPAQIIAVGLDDPAEKKDGDPGPPAEDAAGKAQPSGDSEASETLMDASPAKSPGASSGEPGSATGSPA